MAGLDPAIHAMASIQSRPQELMLHRHGLDRPVKPGDDGGIGANRLSFGAWRSGELSVSCPRRRASREQRRLRIKRVGGSWVAAFAGTTAVIGMTRDLLGDWAGGPDLVRG
jgi:hypothetical protein